jgi:hypothetical protein
MLVVSREELQEFNKVNTGEDKPDLEQWVLEFRKKKEPKKITRAKPVADTVVSE